MEHPIVDSPNGGYDGFPEQVPEERRRAKAFFVPKLCNHCAHSPCVAGLPGRGDVRFARRRRPDRQDALPRLPLLHPGVPVRLPLLRPRTHTADKCTLCYHRITKGLTTACCRELPDGHRGMLVDLKNPNDPIHEFLRDAQDARPQAADGDRREGLLQRPRRRGAIGDDDGRASRALHAMASRATCIRTRCELQWSVLIVLYPYITGLVAGAFILASLERVFNVAAVKPTYRLALLTALAFLLVAPLPLQLHLGHPERSFEMYLTPHTASAMAMFGFVYLWYLMAVLVLEIWFDYRKDLVLTARASTGCKRTLYRVLDALVGQHQPRGARDRRQGRPLHHDHRHSLGVPAPRLRRLHLRIGEGEPVVVVAAHAGRLPLLGDGLRHRARAARSTWR